jgi:hypothetical protein
MAEILTEMPGPKRVLRVSVVDPDWKINSEGSGSVKYRVIEMDQGGATLEIIDFDNGSNNIKEERAGARQMVATPSPS